MLQTLKLLLPALIPSWRFFDVITASPRIEFALLGTAQDSPDHWEEFRPRPKSVSVGNTLKRLFWNPYWNETLFMVSCAERLIDNPTDHSEQEIYARIQRELACRATDKTVTSFVQFRLTLIGRE